MAKKLEGKLKGPSHEKGGIDFELPNGEIQEAEGGEFVIKEKSVNSETQPFLEYINKYGTLPSGKNYKYGGLIRDARKRRK